MLSEERLGPLADAARGAAADLDGRKAVARLFDGDHTLWSDDPTEIADRLGWLACLPEMRATVPELIGVADECLADGLERAVVLGMGGSSLFPEVLARSFGSRPDRLALSILDTTDPAAVARTTGERPPERSLFVAASKSGSTIETRSHLEHAWATYGDPRCFAATTDPGSDLGVLARERAFRHVFENRPDIGGRYSALSLFGLVPAALAGVSCDALLDGGEWMRSLVAPEVAPDDNPGVRLAAALGAGVAAGVDKVTFVVDARVAAFGAWVEQLLAESTGKRGTGVIPVVDEPLGAPPVYGRDRLFVAIGDVGDDRRVALDALAAAGHPVLDVELAAPAGSDEVVAALGAQVLLWEVATALCGALLAINPFDQPDVAAAKAATAAVLAAGDIPDEPLVALAEAVAGAGSGDYLAIQAYVDPGSDVVGGIEAARVRLRDRLHVATTVGLGPRFLHSTGQLHKGGPPTGVFVQVVGDDPDDVPIPGVPYGFSQLKRAQAAGDLRTLRERGLRAARVPLDDLLEAGDR